jgi:hypothetical protein
MLNNMNHTIASLRSFLLLTILIFSAGSTFAQELEGNLSFFGFMDNREYMKSGRYSQTIFGTRISPEVGLRIDSVHRLRVGFNALYEFGSQRANFFDKIEPVIYYQYEKKNVDFFIGSFPRQNLVDDYPRALLSDTLNYYRPNVQGMLGKYETSTFREIIWLDWTSRQTNIDRETFIFGLSGKYQPNKFFISHHAYMFHNAGAAIEVPGDNLQDNGAATVKLGVDLSKSTILDSLTIAAGGMMSFERTRSVSDFVTPKGFVADLYLGYKRFSITNTFYAGEGHHLILGDKFYDAKTYNRIDFGWTPILFKNISGRFVFTYHYADGIMDNQQAFFLRYNISGSKKLR